MNSYRVSLFHTLIFIISTFIYGQDNLVTYELKKGEVFDVLLVTTKKGTKETFKEYREKAFPVAVEMSYSFLPGFTVSEVTQGNFEPKGVVFGKWKSMVLREKFLSEIEDRVPNFHEMRKKIWSVFNLTYYEIQEDSTIQLDSNKILVTTASWKKDNSSSDYQKYINDWKEAVRQTNGILKIELIDGKSPKGYEYNPDYTFITQWDSQEDFNAFQKKNLIMDADFLKNINQFVLSK